MEKLINVNLYPIQALAVVKQGGGTSYTATVT